jgi:aspartyl-tRNA(Asn)/glutamyl-tRNA(Gln) amidotransferase subunit C
MAITAETVRELAELAELELGEGDVARMQRDLAAILAYVEKLSELDTSDVPPTAHVLDIQTPLRPDRAEPPLAVEEAVRNAPEHDRFSMIVPKVLE